METYRLHAYCHKYVLSHTCKYMSMFCLQAYRLYLKDCGGTKQTLSAAAAAYY